MEDCNVYNSMNPPKQLRNSFSLHYVYETMNTAHFTHTTLCAMHTAAHCSLHYVNLKLHAAT